MKKTKKLSLTFLFVFAISSVGQIVAPTLSATEPKVENNTLVNEEQIEKYDKYVIQNKDGYALSKDGYRSLEPSEISLLEEQLKVTNSGFEVSEFTDTGDEYTNTVKDSELGKGARGAGVSKIKYRWWGFEIRLSKSFIRKLSPVIVVAGNAVSQYFSIGGWVGAAIVVAIAATGYAFKNVPHGVKIDYNVIFGRVTKVSWQ